MNARDFAAACERHGLDLPDVFRFPPDAALARENVAEIMDYIEFVALRRHPESRELAYYVPALLEVTLGLPWRSLGAAAPLEDPRAEIFGANLIAATGSRWRMQTMRVKALRKSDEADWRREYLTLFLERPDPV